MIENLIPMNDTDTIENNIEKKRIDITKPLAYLIFFLFVLIFIKIVCINI